MEPETSQTPEVTTDHLAPLKQVTPLSKYLALVLFAALPFIGGYVGYQLAPEKIVEVERVVELKGATAKEQDEHFSSDPQTESKADVADVFEDEPPYYYLVMRETYNEIEGQYLKSEIIAKKELLSTDYIVSELDEINDRTLTYSYKDGVGGYIVSLSVQPRSTLYLDTELYIYGFDTMSKKAKLLFSKTDLAEYITSSEGVPFLSRAPKNLDLVHDQNFLPVLFSVLKCSNCDSPPLEHWLVLYDHDQGGIQKVIDLPSSLEHEFVSSTTFRYKKLVFLEEPDPICEQESGFNCHITRSDWLYENL